MRINLTGNERTRIGINIFHFEIFKFNQFKRIKMGTLKLYRSRGISRSENKINQLNWMPLRHRIRLSNSNVFSIKLRFSAYRLGIQFNSKPSKLLIIWNWSVINVVLLLPIKYLLCASILCGFTCIEGSLSDVIEDTWKEKCKMREHRHNSSAISDRIWIVCCIRSKSVDSRTHWQYIQHVIW